MHNKYTWRVRSGTRLSDQSLLINPTHRMATVLSNKHYSSPL